MAFLNQGPQPEIIINENGVRYIDPNPTDEIVNHEDLVMYVKLVARTKGRSIITSDGTITEIEAEMRNVKNGETNFTYSTGEQYMDTKWTNIGGGSTVLGEDLGAFGITNINIEFKSSFMPQITIDFIDVRGATLFEQGPCSPYSLFFHLPYPVFELTVKGYYGKPVTYTLALTKFNTKFNSETGNFESKAEFVGYTYAFLADIPIGYVMAATYMVKSPFNATNILKDKWQKLRDAHPEMTSGARALPIEPLTLFDLVRNSKKLETEVPALKNTVEVIKVAELSKCRGAVNDFKSTVDRFQAEFLAAIGGNSSKGGIREVDGRKNTVYVLTEKGVAIEEKTAQGEALEVVKLFLGEDDKSFASSEIGNALVETKSLIEELGCSGENIANITFDKIKGDITGFFNTGNLENDNFKDKDYYSVNTYPNLLKNIEEDQKKINDQYKSERDATQEKLNQKVAEILEFWPSIRNVFAIILTNVEVFLQLLIDTSVRAEEYHDREDFTSIKGNSEAGLLELGNYNGAEESNNTEREKIYPWPTYWQKNPQPQGTDEADPGEKEEYPGENENFVAWPEVRFVEAFVDALTKLRQDLEDLEEENVDNLPGFDDYVPTNLFETGAFDSKAPSRWYRIEDSTDVNVKTAVLRVLGENAFIFGDYSCLNTLTLWKSQLGFSDSTWGFQTLSNNWNDPSGTGIGLDTGVNGVGELPRLQKVREQLLASGNKTTANRYDKGKNWEFKGSDPYHWGFEHVSPVTKKKMETWGVIDGLNFLSVCSSTGESQPINIMKNLIDTAGDDDAAVESIYELMVSKENSALKQKYGDNFNIQSWDEWTSTASDSIGVTKATITQQKNAIWNNYYSYVPANKILTLTGPIRLNDSSEVTDLSISANPNNNENNGVRWMDKTAYDGLRAIELDEERMKTNSGESLYGAYQSVFGSKLAKEGEQEEDENKTSVSQKASKLVGESAQKIGLKNMPWWRERSTSPYVGTDIDKDDKKLDIDEKLNVLGYNYSQDGARPLFYYNQTDNGSEAKGNKQHPLIWDLGASRLIYTTQPKGGKFENGRTYEYANFVGAAYSEDAASDAFVQTPLWTLNYPRYKNPWLGGYQHTANWEQVATRGTKTFETKQEPWFTNEPTNITRNFATWWGINSYYTNELSTVNVSTDTKTEGDIGTEQARSNYLLPLAYMAVMSFGFEELGKGRGLSCGHYPPYDGTNSNTLSSFHTLTHSHTTIKPPKPWLLLIGAILWRAKEGKMLRPVGIEPTPGKEFEGWNRENLVCGIDDLSDPVWFFHNCISAPIWGGGCVFTDYGLYHNPLSIRLNITPQYIRSWLGVDGNGFHRWTDSLARFGNNDAVIGANAATPINGDRFGWSIGKVNLDNLNRNILPEGWPKPWVTQAVAIGSMREPGSVPGVGHYNADESYGKGYLKTHAHTESNPYKININVGTPLVKNWTADNASHGFFDQCRQDQIPFIMHDRYDTSPRRMPKTLAITNYNPGAWENEYKESGDIGADGMKMRYYSTAPMRKGNKYPSLKTKVKELMFMPPSLMNEFINYFENWAKEEAMGDASSDVTKENVGWMPTLDPLNWETGKGIGVSGKLAGQWLGDGWGRLPSGFNGFLSFKFKEKVINGANPKNGEVGTAFRQGMAQFREKLEDWNLWYISYAAVNRVDVEVDTGDSGGKVNSNHVSEIDYSIEKPPWSFVSGQKIRLINGKLKNIDDVVESDVLMVYDFENKKFIEGIVSGTVFRYEEESMIKIILDNGLSIITTKNHPFYVEGKGWASYIGDEFNNIPNGVKNLYIDDKVFYLDGEQLVTKKISKIIELKPNSRLVYSILLENANNFIINNVVAYGG